ncbi:hypothetical protein DRB06_07395 [Actinomyces sp. Z5]|uniref:glycoside hydrolase 5 family protein n=1 Tax=Actinomyces sp. Z5 TaxID=2250216 RepID=UPI000DCD310A|nr:hypothetical protein [Actinomyces sp. Z5]RAX20843.1 hypothetical protein DRB06_07395 [Actinomyces sp. Z5]
MRFGVNYTPRVGWFHSWLDLDPALVSEDMATIRSIGADHVRIFPLWPLLQPNRSLIRPAAVDDVLRVVDIAGQAGLTVTVDALQGHLSSFDFLPSWVTSWHDRNLFTDPKAVSGQIRLVRTLARELSSRPHADGLSLGNEFIQFASARHPHRSQLSADEAERWLTTLLGAAREEWPTGELTHSFDDDLWFDDSHPFTPAHALLGDTTTVHSWVFMQVGPRYGSGHPALPLFARYLVELARAWGGPRRSIWLQEVGAPVTYVPNNDAPAFITDTIAHLTGLDGMPSARNLEAITWWCSHDVSRDLTDFPELEYSLGLIDSTGAIKPAGRAFREVVDAARDSASTHAASPGDQPRFVLPTADPARRSTTGPNSELFDQWLRMALQGTVPELRLH